MNTYRIFGISAAMLIALTAFVAFSGGDPTEKVAAPPPEESLVVGQFRIDRWKHYYRHGDAFVDRGNFYWESKLLFADKVIDFCTPRGWGGSALCDERKYRGWFSLRTPSVVSDSPPAVLVPYGGTSGNSDGEIWLFADTGRGLDKKRIASDSNFGITDIDGVRLDYGDRWDFRMHEYLVLNQDTWLHTSSLRVLELSRPVGTLHLSFVSFSPDKKKVARLGYVSNSPDDFVLVLTVNDMENPSLAQVYLLKGMLVHDEERSPAQLSIKAKSKISWRKETSGFNVRSASRELQLVPVEVLLEVPVMSRTDEKVGFAVREFFFIDKSTADLTVTHQKISDYFSARPSSSDVAGDTAKLDLGDWGSYKLIYANQRIYLTDSKDNRGARHVASYIQGKMLENLKHSTQGTTVMH